MFSQKLAFAGLFVACVAAAGGGGYLAMRQSAVPAPASAAAAASSTAAPAPSVPAPAPPADDPAPRSTAEESAAAAPEADSPAPIRTRPETVRAPERSRAAASPEASRPVRSLPAIHTPAAAPVQASQVPPAPVAAPVEPIPATKATDQLAQELPRAPEPPQREFEEVVVPAESVIGLQTETPLSSDRARVEDRVEARVTRDVRVSGRIAIPAGAKAIGSVTQVDRGGKFRERARLAVRFHTLVLTDGTRLPINTETIVREGAEPDAAKKVGGGAVGGAILGAILGGAKGAAIGAAAGAGGGAAVQMAGDRSAVSLPPGTPLTVRIIAPVTIALDKE
jgi:hypothetical protein